MAVKGFGQIVSLFLPCLLPSAAAAEPMADQLCDEQLGKYRTRPRLSGEEMRHD
jgi:hypothetical protein